MHSDLYHLIVYSPLTDSNKVRSAIAKAGGGKIGNYDSCSFSVKGTGRFRPLKGADPAIGDIGIIEEVKEERIEIVVPSSLLSTVLQAVREVHPYEEPAIHVIPMLDYKQFL
jgi:hypothetical protein